MRLNALFSTLSWTWVLSQSLLSLGSTLTGSLHPFRSYRFQLTLRVFPLRPFKTGLSAVFSLSKLTCPPKSETQNHRPALLAVTCFLVGLLS